MRDTGHIPARIQNMEVYIAGFVGTLDYQKVCQDVNNPDAKVLIVARIVITSPVRDYRPDISVRQYFTDGDKWFEEVNVSSRDRTLITYGVHSVSLVLHDAVLECSAPPPHIKGFIKSAISACTSGRGDYFRMTNRGPRPATKASIVDWYDDRIVPIGEKDADKDRQDE